MSLLRSRLRDAAVSAAKSYSHNEVEPRHVLYAVAREFRAKPEVEPLFPAAKSALNPRGRSHDVPALTKEAEEMLASVTSEADAVELLLEVLGKEGESKDRPSGVQAKPAVEEATEARPARTSQVATGPENTADILAELDALIGLEPVKAQVRNVIAVVQANTEREKAGLAPVNPSLHLVFTGPPGTGKTTVARLVARLYASTGALPGANFTEATRADLIAGYVGQTAIKTNDLIQQTRPGVLFIDEAYALTPKVDADFGHEAIATLVKAMEDFRDDLAVIVAGYRDEMSTFVASNPGLRSRLKTYIDFPDYSAEELVRIFETFAASSGIELADGVRERAEQLFASMADKADFGNARFARSLFEQAYARMAARAAEDGIVTVDELLALEPDDIDVDVESLHQKTKRIGFVDGE